MSGCDSPIHLGKEGGDLDRKEERGGKNGGGNACPCAVSWCEVLNGGRITLVACCISDITEPVMLH